MRLYDRYKQTAHAAGSLGLPTATAIDLGDRSAVADALHPWCAPWVLSDTDTEAAAGTALRTSIARALGGDTAGVVLPGDPRVVPQQSVARELARGISCAVRTPDVIIGVGGGTLCDLAKYVASMIGLPTVVVPTAPSVDAYTSRRAAIRIDGYHRTPEVATPARVLFDRSVVQEAPDLLILAGIGDLVAKLIARFDWELAHLVTGERFDRAAANWSARAARSALSEVRRHGARAAAGTVLDALLVTGAVMREIDSSRSAAGAEHTIAHLWEVAPIGIDARHDLHGLLVGAASVHILAAYRAIFGHIAAQRSFADPELAAAREARWREDVPEVMAPYLRKMEEESAGRSLTAIEIHSRQQRFAQHRDVICAMASHAIEELERALALLVEIGFPFEETRVTPDWVRLSLQWVRYLRNRYSAFDLAFELGIEQTVIAQIVPDEPDA